MKRLILALVVVGFFAIPTFVMAGGTVEEMTFFSQALGEDMPLLVYLPEGYGTSGLSYPVVYFIHGMTSDHTSNPQVVEAADLLISNGWTEPFILVLPNAYCFPFVDAGYPLPIHSSFTNSDLNGDYEDYFTEDILEWVEATLRTIPDRDHRFVTGHSQGGYSAMRVALRHPNLFSKVGAHSSPLSYEPMVGFGPMIVAEYPDGTPYDYSPHAGFISKILFAYGASFTPNLSNSPWFVDLAFDPYGLPDPAVLPRFIAHSNTHWAAEFAASGADLGIYFDCGTLDEMGANYLTQYFAGTLDVLGVPYTQRWFVGDHHSHIGIQMPIHFTYFLPLSATVEINPDTLKLRSRGRWVTAYLELPGGLAVSDIDVSTIAITEVDGMELATAIHREGPTAVSDVNGNGVLDLMVKFDRSDLIEQLGGHGGDTVAIVIDGQLLNGWYLEAVDTVKVVN